MSLPVTGFVMMLSSIRVALNIFQFYGLDSLLWLLHRRNGKRLAVDQRILGTYPVFLLICQIAWFVLNDMTESFLFCNGVFREESILSERERKERKPTGYLDKFQQHVVRLAFNEKKNESVPSCN
jgi:hypothetical protein